MVGRIRKYLGALGVLLLAALWLQPGTQVQAKTFMTPYLVEQAHGKAPDVTAYVTGGKMKKSAAFSGTIGDGITLMQSGETVSFEESGEGIRYIVLVDNSGSVEPGQLGEAKKQLMSLRKEMSDADQLCLYTVGGNDSAGSKKNVLGREVQGKDGGNLSADLKKIKGIKYYNSKKSKTVLYRSLREVLEENPTVEKRTVVLLVTDGEDDSTGKNNDKEVIRKAVSESMIPVYGVLLYNKAQKPNKTKMKYTRDKILDEKNCRGYYADCSGTKSKKTVASAFKDIKTIWKKGAFVVHLKAPSNKKVDGIAKLTLTASVDGSAQAMDAVNVNYSSFAEDTTPPEIKDIKKVQENSISFTLSDDSGNVIGADKAANYIIKTKNEKDDGKIWKVSGVNYNSVDNKVVLTFEEALYTGDYTLNCNNICDDTQEQNKLTKSYDFSFEGLDEGKEKTKEFVKSYWWIAVIVLVVVIGLIVVIIVKKKPGKVIEVDPTDMLKADTKLIRLTITDRAGTIKDVEWNVEGSLFVGRSEMCNIFFDDERLSKQHFVIEVTKMACYIEDLESTNGTFVNGVKVTSKRMLLEGDKITAGRETFVFHVMNDSQAAE